MTANHLMELDEGKNRIFVDLIFDLACGEPVSRDCTYEEQLEYYMHKVLPDDPAVEDFIEFGGKYRMTSKIMFPAKPDRIRNRALLLKLFAGFCVLKELYESGSIDAVHNQTAFCERMVERVPLSSEEDRKNFEKEISHLVRRYAEILDDELYRTFHGVMKSVWEPFDNTYACILSYVTTGTVSSRSDAFDELCARYGIAEEERTRFHLEVDAIAETTVIKNQYLEYAEELENEWRMRLARYPYADEVEKYAKTKKTAFVLSYGSKISALRNETFLFVMLAEVTVKLALAEGAGNLPELAQKIKVLTKELGNNIKDTFIDSRKETIRMYRLDRKEDYPQTYRDVLIPYRTDLMYLRDIIIEEISFRNAGNIVHKETKRSKDPGEYELLLSQKDAEIYDLKRELEYYENIKQQEFKAEVSQYNKALTDLFRKMCDFKYNSPLNELYLLATGAKELSDGNVKGILQNLLFILSTMNIVPYETGNVGKKVRFYDDEANIVYAVDDSRVQEGMNQGVQTYPGWKHKDTELVLPRVEIEEES